MDFGIIRPPAFQSPEDAIESAGPEEPMKKSTRTIERMRSSFWRYLCFGSVTIIVGILFIIGVLAMGSKEVEDQMGRVGSYSDAAISCDSPYCAHIGKSMLDKGGSVADAAIAGLICMGIVHSQSMGIGGGFLMILYNGTTKTARMLNARETAPAFATEDMFSGDGNKSQKGGLAVAVPGEIRGYWELWEQHGKLSWKELFQPSIQLAREGFNVTAHTASSLVREWEVLRNVPSMTEIFVNPKTGQVYKEGDLIKRPKLADTLERIAENKAVEFYEGKVGQWFVDDLRDFGGNITMEDMKNYKVQWTDPLSIPIHGHFTLYATPPPGSGLLLGFILKVLSGYAMNPASIGSTEETTKTYHRVVEAFKHAFAYRTQLGDPSDESIAGTVHELIRNLTSEEFTNEIRQRITETEARTNNTYAFYGAKFYTPDDHGTAHLSVISADGDAISITSTINTYFGARIRSGRTGIIYNNEMDDFAAPGINNYFGVPPSVNNFIKPGKRPLSSMTPAIFVDGAGKIKLVIGAAGGTKIITSTALVSLRSLWFVERIQEAVDSPRFHHQLYPMELDLEEGFPRKYESGFKALGHRLQNNTLRSAVTAVVVEGDGLITAKADIRKPGSVAGYYELNYS